MNQAFINFIIFFNYYCNCILLFLKVIKSVFKISHKHGKVFILFSFMKLFLQLFIFAFFVVGSYMLLDSTEAIPGVKAQIQSPQITPSSGCLKLTFHYYLYGTSTTMELSVHTVTTGKRLHLFLCFF